MVRVGEDQGILTLEHQKDTLGYYPNNVVITTEPSHRFTGRIRVYSYACFGLGHRSPPEHVQNRL